MKTAHKFIALAVAGFGFVSCCGIDNNYNCGLKKAGTKEVTTYKEEVQTVYPSGKGALPYTKIVKVPVTKKVKIKEKCDCTDKFNPNGDCCGRISKEVLSRATVQGSTGETHIGLIPTMRPLVTASTN